MKEFIDKHRTLTIVFIILVISLITEKLFGVDLLSDFATLLLYIYAIQCDLEDRVINLEKKRRRSYGR